MWAGQHGDINLITALPRATAPGLQVLRRRRLGRRRRRPTDTVIINTGMMLERLTNGVIPIGHAPGRGRARATTGERYSVVQFCHPTAVDDPVARAVVLHARTPAAVLGDQRRTTRSTWCSTRST